MRNLLCFMCMVTSVASLGVTILDGDIFIQFIGAMYLESKPDGSCTDVEAETVQNLEAIKWTLWTLNDKNYIPGVRIGLLATQTCLKPDEDKRIALELATELMDPNGKIIVGLIGPDYSSETESISRLISSLPLEYRLLQLGFSATSSSLRDRSVYKNFFRTIPPDDIQVSVMHELITKLDWTYMALLYTDDAYGQGGADALLKLTEDSDVCFPVRIPVQQDGNTVSKLETILKEQISGAAIPVSGVVVFGSSSLAENILKAAGNILKEDPSHRKPVFLFSETGNIIVRQLDNVSLGAYVLSPRTRTISAFQSYWKGLFVGDSFPRLYSQIASNIWLKDLYALKFNCTLANTHTSNTCPPLSSDEVSNALPASVYNQYAIQDALIMAKVCKNVLIDKCGSASICDNFRDRSKTQRIDFINKLNTLSVRFDDDFPGFRISEFQDPDLIVEYNGTCEAVLPDEFALYEVYNQQLGEQSSTNKLVKVAEYHHTSGLMVDRSAIKDYDSEGNVLTWPYIRKPQCPDGKYCAACEEEVVDHSVLYIPGDVYVVGIAPVHVMGPTPLKCGAIKQGGVDLVETIRFAVEEAKVKPTAKIGVIVIDSCNDPQLIQEKILTLHKFGVLIDGQYVPVRDKILGYVGGWSSDVSKAIAEVTSRLGYVQISYASTAAVLSKRSLYPYFLRVPTPDNAQAEILLKISKEFGANLIQILYSETQYGEGGRDIIQELIETEYRDICVSQIVGVSMESNPDQIVEQLRKTPNAKIIVSFLGSFEISLLLPALYKLDRNEFLLICSEGWGTRFDLSAYRNLIGTITVTSELTINEKFKDHMKSLLPNGMDVDPWIRNYIEDQFNCYFQWSFDKTSRPPCSGNERLDVYTSSFRIDTWSPFAERAVFALLSAARDVLIDKCGGTRQLCDEFKEDPGALVSALELYRYQEDTQSVRIFDDNGDGTAGYTIYAVTLDQTGHYKKIGVQEPGAFTFQTSVYNNIRGEIVNSSCTPSIRACNVCFPVPRADKESEGISVPAVIAIALLGVLCCVLAGILLFICNRNGCCVKIENGRLKLASPYLTPVYVDEMTMQKKRGNSAKRQIEDENYDIITASSVGYNRSDSSYPSGGRFGASNDSFSTTDRDFSTGSSLGIMNRQNSATSDFKGQDNAGFDGGPRSVSHNIPTQRYVPDMSRQRSSERPDQGYMEASPPPHVFSKNKAPVPPTSPSDVVFQPDGSYITATNEQQKMGDDSHNEDHTNPNHQKQSDSSDKSVGYLGKVKLAE